jgi:hypothetical protein
MKFEVRKLSVLLALCAWTLPGAVEAQETLSGDLFSSDAVLRFTLEADFAALKEDRSQESREFPAVIRIPGINGGMVEVPLDVRTRGRFRLRKDICSFPPLRLDFKRSQQQNTVFDGQDKLKMVTHCHDWDSYEQNMLEEYLAYRIYNQLSDASFRVRLAEVTYLDTSGEDDPVTRMGFLIENEDALAARVGGMILEIPGARATDFEPKQMGAMFLFQYLIGNIDWSTANSQNLAVLRVGFDHFAIPYDFDWSGLVDAPYVGPSPLTERLHDSVRERLYLGVCWDELDYVSAIGLLLEQKEAILEVVQDVPGLNENNVVFATRYVEEFYELIRDPERAARDLRRMCKKG